MGNPVGSLPHKDDSTLQDIFQMYSDEKSYRLILDYNDNEFATLRKLLDDYRAAIEEFSDDSEIQPLADAVIVFLRQNQKTAA